MGGRNYGLERRRPDGHERMTGKEASCAISGPLFVFLAGMIVGVTAMVLLG
jgi:hypothetical protein